jgi:hypothetical protein
MIRNVTLIRWQDGASPAQVQAVSEAMQKLQVQGMRSIRVAVDAGLREGNMHMAVLADFDDEAGYRAYDADPEHNRIRRELIAPILAHVERCQFVLP